MIKLTRADGSPMWLNAKYITAVWPSEYESGTRVCLIGIDQGQLFKESPEEILALISQYMVVQS